MAFCRAEDGTRVHFQVRGRPDGEPLLMIQGLGADKRSWFAQNRSFGRRYRLIALDNRGVGRSDAPAGPYNLEVMAGDALRVLDATGYESAHVLGASMGGVMAQILGVRHPERVRSLVLACTACRHLPWRRELLARWADTARTDGMAAVVRGNLRWLIGPRSVRRFAWPFRLLGPVALNCPPASFAAQIQAILAMDDSLRTELESVTAPTLVVVGSQDILTPRGDSEEIASLVPDAELAVVWGGAHGFLVEQATEFNRTVLDFLDGVQRTNTVEEAGAPWPPHDGRPGRASGKVSPTGTGS